MAKELSGVDLEGIDGYWRAANYLSLGMLYLVHAEKLTS